MLKMILERSIKIQRDVYLCFNDHTKVFDKLGHQEYLELLVNHDIWGKNIIITNTLYWQ